MRRSFLHTSLLCAVRPNVATAAAWWLLASVLLVWVFSTSGCATTTSPGLAVTAGAPRVSVTGSGNLVTRQVGESDFTEVEAGNALKVDVAQSATYGVSVTADDNVIDYVEVAKSGPTLRLGMKNGSYNNATIRVLVTMPDLKGIRFGGASKGTMVGFKPQSMEARLSGASQLTGRLDAGQLDLIVAEASSLNLGGSANSLKLSGSGSSQTSLGDLAVSSAAINLRDASTATVNVKDKLDADLRGASNLYYVGAPILGSMTLLEASSVRRR